jgi:glycosyltransferase involved in cell wall biosynthesis
MSVLPKVKVLVVSTVTPKPTGFGEIILHRHLCERRDLSVEVVPCPPEPITLRAIRRTPFRRLVEAHQVLRQGRRWDRAARGAVEAARPGIMLTVAHGDGFHAAFRLAKETGLPLVTIFHDWWPDLVPSWLSLAEEARFRAVYRGSRLALCASEGMRRVLGEHPCSRVLSPIPGRSDTTSGCGPSSISLDGPFRILYAGNLREYGSMLRNALSSNTDDRLRLEVRGMSPHWPSAFRDNMRSRGLYHEFAPRKELEDWLRSADAFLVTSAFEPSMRRMMETNFPSKLLEFARFGRPLVIWGPAYSTVIKWGLKECRSLCVTQENPAALWTALKKLADSPAEQERFGRRALQAAREEFDPDLIHKQFLDAVMAVARPSGTT